MELLAALSALCGGLHLVGGVHNPDGTILALHLLGITDLHAIFHRYQAAATQLPI